MEDFAKYSDRLISVSDMILDAISTNGGNVSLQQIFSDINSECNILGRDIPDASQIEDAVNFLIRLNFIEKINTQRNA